MKGVIAVYCLWIGFCVGTALGPTVAPSAHADPAYCYSSGEWIPFPDYSGYCLDGEAPFNGPGPSYGGGNHRWPDGSDD